MQANTRIAYVSAIVLTQFGVMRTNHHVSSRLVMTMAVAFANHGIESVRASNVVITAIAARLRTAIVIPTGFIAHRFRRKPYLMFSCKRS